MASIFQGVIQQFSRTVQVFLQKTEKDSKIEDWRPAVLCLSPDSFERYSALELMKWISYRYGFGTYIHFEKDYFSKESKTISANNIRVLPLTGRKTKLDLVNEYSADADLSLIGFHVSTIKSKKGVEAFDGYDKLGNILFVNTLTSKIITKRKTV